VPNKKLWVELEALAAKCMYMEKNDTISCGSSALASLRSRITEAGPDALETLLAAALSGSPRLAALAGPQLSKAYENSLGEAVEGAPIPPRVVSALLDSLGKLPPIAAVRVASAATFVATREKRLDALGKILERRSEMRTTILPRLMRYGRLEAFEEVKRWAMSDDEKTALSAVKAPQLMENWSDDECKQLAPWLQSLLDHKSLDVRGQAAGLLLSCGDDSVKRAFSWFESALRDKQLAREGVFAFGRRCSADNVAVPAEQRAGLATTPVCSKIELVIDRVAADERSDVKVREAALETLVSVWPQRALTRAKALSKHKDAHLAYTARNVIKIVDEERAQ
jgi:hypothetical protein